MNKIKIILLILFLLFICNIIEASELKTLDLNNNRSSSFFTIEDNHSESINIYDITYLAKNNKDIKLYGGKGGGFLVMGIIGAVVFGIGWLLIIPGIALAVYAYLTPISSSGSNIWESVGTIIGSTFIKTYYLVCGIALIVLGSIFVVVGLPLMIVGFVNYSKKRKSNVSFILDANQNGTINTGLKILM